MPKVRKFGNYTPKPLDPDLFQELLHILHRILFDGNWSATARALGVSKPTALRWVNNPPTAPWWNLVLRTIIRDLTRQMRLSPHKKHTQRAGDAIKRLQQLPHVEIDVEDFEDPSDAARDILTTVNLAPGQELTADQIRQRTGRSKREIRTAAARLCLHRTTTGFGADKETYYSIPRGDEE